MKAAQQLIFSRTQSLPSIHSVIPHCSNCRQVLPHGHESFQQERPHCPYCGYATQNIREMCDRHALDAGVMQSPCQTSEFTPMSSSTSEYASSASSSSFYSRGSSVDTTVLLSQHVYHLLTPVFSEKSNQPPKTSPVRRKNGCSEASIPTTCESWKTCWKSTAMCSKERRSLPPMQNRRA